MAFPAPPLNDEVPIPDGFSQYPGEPPEFKVGQSVYVRRLDPSHPDVYTDWLPGTVIGHAPVKTENDHYSYQFLVRITERSNRTYLFSPWLGEMRDIMSPDPLSKRPPPVLTAVGMLPRTLYAYVVSSSQTMPARYQWHAAHLQSDPRVPEPLVHLVGGPCAGQPALAKRLLPFTRETADVCQMAGEEISPDSPRPTV